MFSGGVAAVSGVKAGADQPVTQAELFELTPEAARPPNPAGNAASKQLSVGLIVLNYFSYFSEIEDTFIRRAASI